MNVVWVNMPPEANAGGSQIVYSGDRVTLSALKSTDPDDGIAAYYWKQIQGPAVSLTNGTSAQASFTAPTVAKNGVSLIFELTVTDKGGLQSTDTCIVNVAWTNEPPVAVPGPDQQVLPGDKVVLNGTGSKDSDDGITAYQWKQTAGPPVALSNAGAAQSFFTAPAVAEQDIHLTFQLTVTDAGGLQSIGQCRVTVRFVASSEDTQPPVVSIVKPSSGFTITRQTTIALEGTATDNDRVDRVVWENDRGGSGRATGTTKWSIPKVLLSRGFNVITITAYDAAGNKTSTKTTVYVSVWR